MVMCSLKPSSASDDIYQSFLVGGVVICQFILAESEDELTEEPAPSPYRFEHS